MSNYEMNEENQEIDGVFMCNYDNGIGCKPEPVT